MNPLHRQPAIREFELFVSGGVHEIPESVYERNSRAAGEVRVVREMGQVSIPSRPIDRVIVGVVKVDRKTGEVVD
jgi:hypothetical protein